jgi:hypothetical protein
MEVRQRQFVVGATQVGVCVANSQLDEWGYFDVSRGLSLCESGSAQRMTGVGHFDAAKQLRANRRHPTFGLCDDRELRQRC